MMFKDKRGVLSGLRGNSKTIIELGCGPRKRDPHAIGIDSEDFDCVDIVGDAVEVLRAIPDAAVDRIQSSHFLEHVQDLSGIIAEVTRVLKQGGVMEAVVPHFSNPYFYSDPTHVHTFGLYTFSYLANETHFRRRVPAYVRHPALELRRADLIFKSTRPFYGRYAIKRVLGSLFNASRYMQEFYEENLCFMFPCYEVRFVLEKVSS